jgi:hypothetical protein
MIPVPNKGEDSMRRFITWMSSLLLVFLLAACIEPDDPVTDPNVLYPSGSTVPCQTPPPTLVHFGTYPQTLASPQAVATMSDTPGVDGYYISSYDNERYAKVIADPYAATYTFTNGDAIDVGTPYYFRVDPIAWRVLDQSNKTESFLVADLVLDFGPFDNQENDWVTSDLRDWLNDTFYNTAFLPAEQQKIVATTLVHDTTSPPIVNSQQPDTIDSVFLLSYADLIDPNHRFHPDPTNYDCERTAATSDYARTQHGILHTYDDVFGYAFWWSRSAGGHRIGPVDQVTYVGTRGMIWYDGAYDHDYIGIRPAIRADISHLLPVADGDDRYLFGEYPQSLADPDAVAQMGTVPDAQGYYTSLFDNERYAKLVATPGRTDYQFANGEPVDEGETYYFKVEPVSWRVLTTNANQVFVLSEHILDTTFFDDIDTDWASSMMRDWMRTTMYPTLFTPAQQFIIQPTQLDNQTTAFLPTPGHANTIDELFLLSHADAINQTYGFDDFDLVVANRTALTTDYALARGVYVSFAITHQNHGQWWLRSSGSSNAVFSCIILYDGVGDPTYPYSNKGVGIRPAFWFTH